MAFTEFCGNPASVPQERMIGFGNASGEGSSVVPKADCRASMGTAREDAAWRTIRFRVNRIAL
jgi:hypothetical protein